MLRMEHINTGGRYIQGGGGSQIYFATSKYFVHKCTANNYANSMAELYSGGVRFKTAFIYILWEGFLIITDSNFDFKCIIRTLNFVTDFVLTIQ